jgi:hypothetical protein
MNWFFSMVRVAGAAFPVSSMLVQLQAEIDSNELNNRLNRLEDPISHLHENVHDISEVMYKKIKQLDNLKINLDDEEYEKYSRVLAVLESKSFIKGSHTIGKRFAKGLRIIDPTYVLYMCALFENSNEMEKLRNRVETCRIGQQLNGKTLQNEINLPLSIIGSVFKIYETKGYGVCSNEIGATIYIGKA